MKRFISVFVLIFLLSGSVLAETDAKDARNIVDNTYKNLDPFAKALEYIVRSYVDEDKLKGNELMHGAIKGMLATLDTYSIFMDPEEFNELNEDTNGFFGGVGVEISIRNDILTVVTPYEKGPAWSKGVRAGDRILKVDGVSTKNMSISDAVKKIRGPKGTKVVLTILHEGAEKTEDVEITRDSIKVASVMSFITKDNIGYLRLRSFIQSSSGDVEKALSDFEKSRVKGIIFDLRNNPGGLLVSSIAIADKFLPKDKLIVFTKGRMEESNKKHYSFGGDAFYENIPLVLLVNKGSASASEIVTGALQDNKRAIVIGTQTFGKASVQSIYRIKEDSGKESGMKLTTAYYYTPSGKKIHDKGITPDVIVEPKLPADVVWRLRYYEHFINYSKKYVKDNPNADVDNMIIDDKIYDDFIKEVKSKGFVLIDNDLSISKDYIKKMIKVEIVKAVKGEDAGERAAAEMEDEVERAVELLNGYELFKKVIEGTTAK